VKVLGVSGSPRKDGNSDVAAKTILEILRDLGETEFIRIADYTIKHCIGCGRCWKLHQCVIADDDFQELFGKWMEADLIVISDPVYWLNPPGIVKDFIDRTFSVVNQPKLSFANAKVALVTVAAENGFELHNELLSRWLKVHDAQVVGSIDVYASEKNDLVQDRSQIAKLKEFASEIIGKVNGYQESTERGLIIRTQFFTHKK
jgi:multimeric flavodoxin WrbA